MYKHTHKKNLSTSTKRVRPRSIWLLSLIVLLFVLCSVLLIFAYHSQTTTSVTGISTRTSIATATKMPQKSLAVTPVATQPKPNKTLGPQQPTVISVHTAVVATPTLATSTPQHTQLGVFPLSTGGPLPVPESVLHPTNIARAMIGSTLISIYAGSMTSNPQIGILCVLRENLTTGELHLQVYQGPQTGGALTILSVQNNILKIANTKMQGTFDLTTNIFKW